MSQQNEFDLVNSSEDWTVLNPEMTSSNDLNGIKTSEVDLLQVENSDKISDFPDFKPVI
jgi:hypothetical protein